MPNEEELAPNEEIHTLNAGGFVPGLPGLFGPGTRIVVDRESGQPLRVLSPPAPPQSVTEAQPDEPESPAPPLQQEVLAPTQPQIDTSGHPVDALPVQEVPPVEQSAEPVTPEAAPPTEQEAQQ